MVKTFKNIDCYYYTPVKGNMRINKSEIYKIIELLNQQD